MSKDFGKDFAWGVASSSLQSEGSLNADGRSPSIWDSTFLACHSNGDDSLRHIDEDVALLKELGVNSYRFSLSWSRLIPDGIGPVNEKAKEMYIAFVKKLLAAGIEPYVTLFHWDYPQVLENKGGWLSEESPYWLAYYAREVAEMFDGLVDHYFTINEPQCFIEQGYRTGQKAPFKKLTRLETLKIAHHVLLGNGLALRALRTNSSAKVYVGMANTYAPSFPRDFDDPFDIEAAREANFAFRDDLFCLPYWADPAFLGHYPADWLRGFNEPSFKPSDSDMEIIKGDWDFFALNIYGGIPVKNDNGKPVRVIDHCVEKNSLGWEIHPDGIYWGARYAYERYGLPIIISENGVSLNDKLTGDFRVHDLRRSHFLITYLTALHAAQEDDIPIKGYFHWSFLDNFEWELGYKPRFGLVYVDYPHEADRIKKDSFDFYKEIIDTNGENLLKEN
jgi:beta-glucosidase